MFPCRGTAHSSFAYRNSHLLHFSEHQICIFKVQTAEWVQSINLRLSRPLHSNGLFVLCQILDLPHLIILGTNQPGEFLKSLFERYFNISRFNGKVLFIF